MRNLPNWIPNPTAWMSAILLLILARGVSVVITIIAQLGDSLIWLPPKWKSILYIVALLSPILIIAVAHHLLHFILDRFFPNIRTPEMTERQGFFPGLMSWWEGFYGWQAIALALLVSSGIQLFFLSSFNSLYDMLDWWNELKKLFTIPNLIRLLIIAYLYQLEYLVRQHLMSVGSNSQSNQS